MQEITFEQLPKAVTQLLDKIDNIERLLLAQGRSKDEADKLLTINEAAKLVTLSVSTIYRLVQADAIPVSKKGKRLYFSSQDLYAWIKEGKKKTASELADDVFLFQRKG